MSLNCLFKPYLFAVIGVGGSGTPIPIIVWKKQCSPQPTRLAPTPMIYAKDGCSSRFFPNVEMGHDFKFWEIGDKKFQEIKINPPEDKYSGDEVGCFFAKSSSSPKYKDRYVFFEMAMMNDRIGWSLWADSQEKRTVNSAPSIGLEYKLFLLQREEEGDWKISGGYRWKDNNFLEGNRAIHIDLPEKPGWVSREMADDCFDEEPVQIGISEYSAIWKQDKIKGKEIFEPIRVWSRNKGKSDLFGTKGNFSERKREKGYSQVSDFYHKEWKSWGVHLEGKGNVKQLAKVDIGGVLADWYKPFKGKRGSWIPFNKYCEDRKNGDQKAYVLGCKMVEI